LKLKEVILSLLPKTFPPLLRINKSSLLEPAFDSKGFNFHYYVHIFPNLKDKTDCIKIPEYKEEEKRKGGGQMFLNACL